MNIFNPWQIRQNKNMAELHFRNTTNKNTTKDKTSFTST